MRAVSLDGVYVLSLHTRRFPDARGLSRCTDAVHDLDARDKDDMWRTESRGDGDTCGAQSLTDYPTNAHDAVGGTRGIGEAL